MGLALSNPVGATLTTPSSTVLTIADNDVAGTIQFSDAAYSATQHAGAVTVTVTRTGGAAGGVTVAYATSDGTGTAGTTYVATSGTLGFDAGETGKTFQVPLIAIAAPRPTQTVVLTLSDPSRGASLGIPNGAQIYVVGDLDVTPPSVAITAPAAGATVSGRVTLTASATDFVGVAGVRFRLDGVDLGAELTAAPYTMTWDAILTPPGAHTLTAVARDAAGNVGVSAGVTVTVKADTTLPVLSGVAVSSITPSGAMLTWATNKMSDSQAEYGWTTT